MKLTPVLVAATLLAPACATDEGDPEDGENDSVTGKADLPGEGTVDALAILAVVNDTAGIDEADLDYAVALSARTARNIIAYRDGADREPGTADDNLFDTIAELDGIPYVGPVAMRRLLEFARTTPETTLTVQLVAQEWLDGPDMWATVDLASLNDEMAEYGISFPASLTIGARDGARFNKVVADIAVANDKLGREIELDHSWDPSDYVGLCYTGNVAAVPAVVEGLRGSMFSVYMGIQGERWQTHKVFHYSGGEGDNEAEWLRYQREEHPEIVELWESYDTSSDTYLMMTDGGQQGDGTEFFGVRVPRCRS
jgi:hypothetical protein